MQNSEQVGNSTNVGGTDETTAMSGSSTKVYGWTLIVASCAMVVFMAMHPSVHSHDLAEVVAALAKMEAFNSAVHGILIGVTLVVTVGLFGMVRWLGAGRPMVLFGMVFAAAAHGALIAAAVISGFVLVRLAARYDGTTGTTLEAMRPLMFLCHAANQACSQLGTVGVGVAMVVWSVVLARRGLLGPGILGAAAGLGMAVAVSLGKLPMNVHGFGLVVVAYAVWCVMVGVAMVRAGRPRQSN